MQECAGGSWPNPHRQREPSSRAESSSSVERNELPPLRLLVVVVVVVVIVVVVVACLLLVLESLALSAICASSSLAAASPSAVAVAVGALPKTLPSSSHACAVGSPRPPLCPSLRDRCCRCLLLHSAPSSPRPATLWFCLSLLPFPSVRVTFSLMSESTSSCEYSRSCSRCKNTSPSPPPPPLSLSALWSESSLIPSTAWLSGMTLSRSDEPCAEGVVGRLPVPASSGNKRPPPAWPRTAGLPRLLGRLAVVAAAGLGICPTSPRRMSESIGSNSCCCAKWSATLNVCDDAEKWRSRSGTE